MGGNAAEAEDALSRAMFKAWEKVQKGSEKITNFKGWLTRLTHNLCVDIHRQHRRDPDQVEDIETISEQNALVFFDHTPESVLEAEEEKSTIRRAIENLPPRLRQAFILNYYQEFSYQEIAKQQEISYDNVCKRISQARTILREGLRGYFIGEDGPNQRLSVTSTWVGRKFVVTGESQPNGKNINNAKKGSGFNWKDRHIDVAR